MLLPNNWLDKEANCESCGKETTIGYLIVLDGDNICEDCFDTIYPQKCNTTNNQQNNTEKIMKFKITQASYNWLLKNHGGQHCPIYWVLCRVTAPSRKADKIDITEEEAARIPDRYLRTR